MVKLLGLDGTQYFKDFSDVARRELESRTPDKNARDALLLRDPDGAIWEVKVDNTGTISTTKIYG